MNSTFLDFNFFNITDFPKNCIFSENNKSLLIVISEQEKRDEELKSLLSKILSAIKYDINKDVNTIILNPDDSISLSAFCQKNDITIVLSFGFEGQKLGVYANHRKYVFIEINEINYLFCDSLKEISSQNNLKAALWEALKNKLL